jgi:hypothetical protein
MRSCKFGTERISVKPNGRSWVGTLLITIAVPESARLGRTGGSCFFEGRGGRSLGTELKEDGEGYGLDALVFVCVVVLLKEVLRVKVDEDDSTGFAAAGGGGGGGGAPFGSSRFWAVTFDCVLWCGFPHSLEVLGFFLKLCTGISFCGEVLCGSNACSWSFLRYLSGDCELDLPLRIDIEVFSRKLGRLSVLAIVFDRLGTSMFPVAT